MSQSESSEPPSTSVGVVILAAGRGTRMCSPLPKVLHPVAGRPMVQYAVDIARELGATRSLVVVPPDSAELQAALVPVPTVEQSEQLGTGHAVLQARDLLMDQVDRVLVLYADTALVRTTTAQRLLDQLAGATIAILTGELPDPAGYGRILRDATGGQVARIVEAAEACAEILGLREVNSGLMAFQADWLWDRLPRLQPKANGEFYLTDLVELAIAERRVVGSVRADDATEIVGINSQAQLAQANRAAWDRAADRLMSAGVTIVDPATTYVEGDVQVGAGTIIYPNTHLQGGTHIGPCCAIGPNSTIRNSLIGEGSRVWASVVEDSELEPLVQLGPFSHVRPGTYLEREVCLGNYAEVKASRIGRGTQVHHFSYLGDAEVGAEVNIGAGTITCNYDGAEKHRTFIGDQAFIGSDSMLVAPLSVGARARTGAGSVVTRDVPPDVTVVGVPARPAASKAQSTRSGKKDGE